MTLGKDANSQMECWSRALGQKWVKQEFEQRPEGRSQEKVEKDVMGNWGDVLVKEMKMRVNQESVV